MPLDPNKSFFYNAQENSEALMNFATSARERMMGYIASHHLTIDARLAVLPDDDFSDICIRAAHDFDIKKGVLITVSSDALPEASHEALFADLQEMIESRYTRFARNRQSKELVNKFVDRVTSIFPSRQSR